MTLVDEPTADRAYFHARDVAVETARAAGRLMRQHAGRLSEASVRLKGEHDLVTAFDEEVERRIVEHLQAEFPDAEILAEEGSGASEAGNTPNGFRWIIDPIDGTTNFIKGLAPYSVSIALQHGANVVVGVVLEVAANELFTAVRGDGLYCNGTRVRTSVTERLQDAVVATGMPYKMIGLRESFLAVLGEVMTRTHGFRRLGSAAADLAYVACGRLDGFYEVGLSPWDAAAGMLLVREGGGCVTSLSGDPDPLYGGSYLATNGHIHAELQALMEPLIAASLQQSE